MTARSKTEIKAFFETNDRPSQSNFGDLIDSYADVSSAVTSFTGDVTATINNGVATTTIASAAVGTTKIEGRSVTLAKQAFGSGVGQIYYTDVSGVPTLLTAGVSGQTLRMGTSIPVWNTVTAPAQQLVLLGTATAAVSSSLDFPSLITSAYTRYMVVFEDLLFSQSASPQLKISSDNGATYTETLTGQRRTLSAAATSNNGTSIASTPAILAAASTVTFSGFADFTTTANSGFLWKSLINAHATDFDEAYVNNASAAGTYTNAFQITPSAGTITSGKVYLYGIKNT